jgi:hypothetical protein
LTASGGGLIFWPMKLGEYFIQKGLLTTAQLEEALKLQLIFGGHLGTCLLEMGHVTEAKLGETLAGVFKVSYAPPHFFHNIPKSVIDLMPKRIVEKHHAVPFEKKEKLLRVAMIDPKNLPALDEIAFATGHRIEPWVAPEARIFQVMERYYEINRRQRYISVCQNLDNASRAAAGGAQNAHTGMASAYAPPPYLSELGPTPDVAPKAAPMPAASTSEAMPEGSMPSAPPSAPQPAAAAQARLSEALCSAESASELAEAVLDHVQRDLPRCALFLVKSVNAALWNARGTGVDGPGDGRVILSVTTDPVFELLHERDYFRGRLPSDPRMRGFFEKTLRMEVPGEMMLMPGYSDDRLVVLLYADGGPYDPIQAKTEEVRTLVAKLACALHLVVLKKRIRSFDAPPETQRHPKAA